MSFTLLDITGVPVKGCASFKYKGFSVSMSTLAGFHEVHLFKDHDGSFSKSFGTVEDAIQWIEDGGCNPS